MSSGLKPMQFKIRLAEQHSSGFTLIEVVISISILAIMLSVVYGSLFTMIRAKNILEDRRDLESIAYAVVGRMSREFQLASWGVPLLPSRDDTTATPNSNIFLLGEAKTLDKDVQGDSIRFMASEGGQYLPDGGTHSGIVQIGYRVEEDPDQKDTKDPTYVLVREEVPNVRPYEKAYENAMIFPITNRLVSLRIRYYDLRQDKWFDSWGTEGREQLPTKIQFSVKLKSTAGEEKEYLTTIALRQKS